MTKWLIFDAFTGLTCKKISQITHFCGVKLLAWKSGGVNFLTNIMSAWGCRGQGVRRPQEAFQREGTPEVFWYQLVGPGTFTRVIDISREEAWHKQTDGPKNNIMGFAEQSLQNNFAQMPACLWAGSASFTVARSCRSTVALEILTRLSSLTAQRTQAVQVDANTGPILDFARRPNMCGQTRWMRADGSDKSVLGHLRNGFLGHMRVANRESIGRLIETVSNCFRSPICHILDTFGRDKF